MKRKKNLFFAMSLLCITGSAWVYGSNENTETAIVHQSPVRVQSASTKENAKILVAYFTMPETDGVDALSGASRLVSNGKLYGNTEYVATLIAEATQAELFPIQTVRTYPGSHKELVDAAKQEADAKEHPRLKAHIDNLKEYDIIFVGYPNWWYDMPMPLYTFFEEHDFTGKTVIPFCTHGGSRFSQSVKTITEIEKGATVLQGPSVSRERVEEAKGSVTKWLQKQGFIK